MGLPHEKGHSFGILICALPGWGVEVASKVRAGLIDLPYAL